MMKANDCCMCSKAFNKYLRKPVTCLRCTVTVCKSCLIENKNAIPKCLQCNYEFDDDFIATHFTKNFLVNDLKVHRRNALFQKEEMMLPETKPYAAYELKMRELRKRMQKEHTEFKLLEKKYKAHMNFYKSTLNEWDRNHSMITPITESVKTITETATEYNALPDNIELQDIDDIKRLPDIPCAIDTLLKYHNLLQNVLVNELAVKPVVVDDAFMENIDIRIKYSLREYSKDEFIKFIFNNDKNKNKIKDRYNIFNTLFIEGVLLFDELLECSNMECIASIIVAFDDLLSRKNTAIQSVSKKYSCKMPSIVAA
jgi:hypothetical protein